MSLYELVTQRETWEEFLALEEEKDYPDHKTIKTVKKIIKDEQYLKFDKEFMDTFSLSRLVQISHYNTSKKRIVYVYPEPYRSILKVVGKYMLSKYNNSFCKNSIAYTQGRSVRSAFSILGSFHLKLGDPVYKNDFSDYFNSIDIDLLDAKLKDFLDFEDNNLHIFIMKLLREQKVFVKDNIETVETKGVMAGSPIAGILANVFMHKVDMLMYEHKYHYIRYADDTLIHGEEALEAFKKGVAEAGVILNPKKMATMTLGTGITFLGFKHKGNITDISEDALAKMKSRFKRRAKWYRIWMRLNRVPKYKALRDYIKKINQKLYSDQDDSINWSRWYLPNINTIESLKYLDKYFITCIRYLNSGTWHRGKKFYKLSYKDIKRMGYKSLVNEYYKTKKEKH